MKLSEHKELKREILALPPKEKDKLLLRLVAKDKVLTEHLHFMLLEDEAGLEERTTAIKEQILATMEKLKSQRNVNPKEILTNLRKLAKAVNHNLKVTKSMVDDVELRIYLFNHTVTEFKSGIFSGYKNYEHLFWNYFIRATVVTLRKFDKLHDDLQFDLKPEMNSLLAKIYKGNMRQLAKELGLPKEMI